MSAVPPSGSGFNSAYNFMGIKEQSAFPEEKAAMEEMTNGPAIEDETNRRLQRQSAIIDKAMSAIDALMRQSHLQRSVPKGDPKAS